MEKNKVEITIRGRKHTLVGTRSKEEMQSAADKVNEQIAAIQKQSNITSQDKLMDLCALNLAGEVISANDTIKELEARLESADKNLAQVRRQLSITQEQLRSQIAQNELKID
ncbi:MAG: cell division protein ZapA [Clostridiales bacterium]|nr:cell division protein ZapA [Clostridiales bacterium]